MPVQKRGPGRPPTKKLTPNATIRQLFAATMDGVRTHVSNPGRKELIAGLKAWQAKTLGAMKPAAKVATAGGQ